MYDLDDFDLDIAAGGNLDEFLTAVTDGTDAFLAYANEVAEETTPGELLVLAELRADTDPDLTYDERADIRAAVAARRVDLAAIEAAERATARAKAGAEAVEAEFAATLFAAA